MHHHSFSKSDWPFSCPENMCCITTKQVMEKGFPILSVLHDEEGTWQVLCDTTEDPDDGKIICLGCLFEKFSLIGQFANLKPGYEACRKSEAEEWIIEKTEYNEN